MTIEIQLEDYNAWADFWRYQIGINVIPAIYKSKTPIVKWLEWQTNPIPKQLHDQWKLENKFKDGMAIVTGNIWHNDKIGKYLACLDTDNELATKLIALSENKTLVQQRKNALDRTHSYFYSPRPVKRKPSSSNTGDLAPKFELRCVGDLIYTGRHQSGYYYEIVGQTIPANLSLEQVEGIENKVQDICNEYRLNNSLDQPASELFKEDFEIYEGQNRSRELKRVMCSLLQRNWGIMSFDEIKDFADKWHNKHCKPPYPNGVFERNWKQSLEFIARKREEGIIGAEPLRQQGEATTPQEPKKEWTEAEVDEWRVGLNERYQELYNTIKDNLPNLWDPLDFALSVKSILNIRGCDLPFAGIILGKASSLKTVAIESFRDYNWTYFSNEFSARSFVSHSAKVKKDKLKEIDLLPRIRNKLLLTPELGPMFSKRDEDILGEIGILTSILDGNGFKSDSGVHGERGYTGEYFFTMLGAAVDVPGRVYRYLSTLGPKLYFFRISKPNENEDYYYIQQQNDFKKKLKPIKEALQKYLTQFDMNPMIVEENGLSKIPLNSEKDDEKAIRYIIKLSILLGPLRTVVPTRETYGSHGSDYGYRIAIVEDPSRAIQQLLNLARGHALTCGRNYIIEDDIPIVIQTVLSTAPLERVAIFNILLENKGTLTTSEICKFLNITKNTALRTMVELKAVGLVTISPDEEEEEDYNVLKSITLKQEFRWFLGDTFKKLRCLEKKGCVSVLYTRKSVYASNIEKDINTHKGDFSRHPPPTKRILCRNCDFETPEGNEYDKHTVHKHRGKAGYPTRVRE